MAGVVPEGDQYSERLDALAERSFVLLERQLELCEAGAQRFVELEEELSRLRRAARRSGSGEIVVDEELRKRLMLALRDAAYAVSVKDALATIHKLIDHRIGKPAQKIKVEEERSVVFAWDDPAVASAAVLRRELERRRALPEAVEGGVVAVEE